MARSLWSRRSGLALAGLISLGVLAGSAHASNVSTGSVAPDFGGTWLNHESTTLNDLRGRAVLVEFWGVT